MAKTLIVYGGTGTTQSFNATAYYALSGYTPVTTENQTEITFRTAGTLSNIYTRIVANTVNGSSTFKSRKNQADGAQSLSIGASTTGEFEDTSSSDTIAAGDEACYSIVTGGTSGTMTANIMSALFAASTNTVCKYNTRETGTNSAATTYYRPLVSSANTSNTTEANVQFKVGTAGTFKNGYVWVSANGVTSTTTVKSRKNGADGGIAVSVTASTTGVFEDTSGTDTVASGDKLNWAVVVGSGGTTITCSMISGEFESTNAKFPVIWNVMSGIGVGAGDVTECIGGGTTAPSTELNSRVEANFAGTARNLWTYVSANTRTTATTTTLRLNGANTALTISVAGSGTGEFEDATNAPTFIATDELNYFVVTGSGSGTYTVRTIGCTLENTESAAAPRRIFSIT